jgi:lipopolysaccharide transport system ATP-binding protein
MSADAVISVRNVSKAYRIWDTPAARLTSALQEGLAAVLPSQSSPARLLRERSARHYKDFHALRDISFEIGKGESAGIIGRNGSGKSTLLQIIAGTLQPTEGTVKVKGKVAALLELGSGFNPEFTGEENVFLYATVLGLTRSEIEQKFDQIAAFADIGSFIHQPVLTYSSGMMVRLAFAVSVCLKPDILIVDEALSVGDVFFQQKCFKRIHELIESGTSLLFVSHDTAAVQNLCDHAILLKEGRQVFTGAPEEAVSRYFALSSATAHEDVAANQPTVAENADTAIHVAAAEGHNILGRARARHGSRDLEIVAACAQNEFGAHQLQIEMGHPLDFTFVVEARKPVLMPQAGLNLYNRFNTLVFASSNHNIGYSLGALQAGDRLALKFRLTLNVEPGEYTASLIVSEESVEGPNAGMFYDVHEGIGPITVYFSPNALMPFYGVAKLPLEFTHSSRLPAPALSRLHEKVLTPR